MHRHAATTPWPKLHVCEGQAEHVDTRPQLRALGWGAGSSWPADVSTLGLLCLPMGKARMLSDAMRYPLAQGRC